jgi:uncharacterized phage infection (PIP) family protein YhgE
MLFNNRLNQVNADINFIQDQIATLQAKLTELQAFSQQLSSVDQAADSAIAQVASALESISYACPEELPTFKAALEALFNNPLRLAAAAESVDINSASNPAPHTPDNEVEIQDAEFVESEEEEVAETTETPETAEEVQPSEHTENGHNGNGNGHSESSKIEPVLSTEDLKKYDRPLLIRLANKQGIQGVKAKKNNQLIAELVGKVTQSDIDQLLATITK